jgi:4'-phosphopantetheinyl transferase
VRHNCFVNQAAATHSDLDTEVHVWLARPDDITDVKRLDSYVRMLSEGERKRHERFHFDVHRKLYLVSHALVRTALSRYADTSANQWRFSKGEFGRPEISTENGTPRLRFNLSHTEGLAALVICLDDDCGLDVERLNRVKDLHGVAKRVFTPRELEDLSRRTGDSLQGRFTDYWTLKEAYMKARGMGFQLPPHTFSIRLPEMGHAPATLELPAGFDDRSDRWRLSLHPLSHWESPAYRLAIALRRGDAAPRRIAIRQVVPG